MIKSHSRSYIVCKSASIEIARGDGVRFGMIGIIGGIGGGSNGNIVGGIVESSIGLIGGIGGGASETITARCGDAHELFEQPISSGEIARSCDV